MNAQKNIKAKLISYIILAVVFFYVHELFRDVHYDVLHINTEINVLGYSYYVKDIFPFHDFEEGQTLDLQWYLWRLGIKVNFCILAYLIRSLVSLLNLLLVDYFKYVLRFVKSFYWFCFFEVVFFVFYASAVAWWVNLLLYAAFFLFPLFEYKLTKKGLSITNPGI